jgi:hypothetical protein
MQATRITDGSPVVLMLKRVPYGKVLTGCKWTSLFPSEPFTCTTEIIAHFFDDIELQNEPPIRMRPILRPFL